MGADRLDADLLIDNIHAVEAVETDLVQTLLAGLVDGGEAGTQVLLLAAVQRPRVHGLHLHSPQF